MIKFLCRSCMGLLLACLILAAPYTVANASSCFPNCSSVDSRFLMVVVGPTFQTLTTETLNLRIIVPGGDSSFTFSIFDGDSQPGIVTETHWDVGVPFEYRYELKVDPDQNNDGDVIFTTSGTSLPDNGWSTDFEFATSEAARDANGDFVYTLTATAVGPLNPAHPFLTANSFKVRSSGLIAVSEIFTFVSEAASIVDLGIIYPNLDDSDGVDEADKIGANYDGEFCFLFNIEGNLTELDFWDGDADRGNFNGTQTDADDPNTPNVIPAFAPLSSDVVAEGVNIPAPFDDKNPNSDFNFLTLVPGSVSYRLTFPDGQQFVNNNPSGNTEWELFRISTLTNDPNITDATTDIIPPGEYELCFLGLDINNFVSLRPPSSFVIFGEDIPDPTDVPTMSEWGLILFALITGLIGILAVIRRKAQVSQ